MAIISLEGMEFYAHHGCYREEQIIGTRFVVDFYFESDTQDAGLSDNLQHTINYQQVYSLIREEMGIRANLLEHLSWRIMKRMLATFPGMLFAEIKISKVNPPLGGQVGYVSVALDSDEFSRQQEEGGGR